MAMVSDAVFADFVAELEPQHVPRRFVTCVIYSIEGSEQWLYMREPTDIDDFLEMHPRMDGLVGRGVLVDYDRLRAAIDLEVEYIMVSARRGL
jgi:hypothetical protein